MKTFRFASFDVVSLLNCARAFRVAGSSRRSEGYSYSRSSYGGIYDLIFIGILTNLGHLCQQLTGVRQMFKDRGKD